MSTKQDDHGLTNHEITICLVGGAILGPFRATWSKEITSDVRELTKDYDAFLQGSDRMIRCRWHNYVFRLADGKGINCPGYKLRVFDVKLENGALYARAV